MAFRKKFAPALINAANVKGLHSQSSLSRDDGTGKSNAVAKKEDYCNFIASIARFFYFSFYREE